MQINRFSDEDYNQSRQDYAQQWQTLDEILYRLCREHLLHTDQLSVNAKIWIIGRTYATGIERKVPTTGAPGSSISQVANFFFRHNKQIDDWIDHLPKVPEQLAASNVPNILTIHGLMSTKLTEITRENQSARSFVSKYLHFHSPCVPIYDSVAPKSIRSIDPHRAVRDSESSSPEHADQEYAEYVGRFLRLYEYVASRGLQITVRSLDYYLVWKRTQAVSS
jgi:hypothetical protein